MQIKIFWNSEDAIKLFNITKKVIKELDLKDIVSIDKIADKNYKKELWIKKIPAFCVEEESIDFKDVIFEWEVPSKKELTAIIISIIWWEDNWNCHSCSNCNNCWMY